MPQQKEIPLGEDFIPLGQDFEPVDESVSEPGFLASLWQKANEPMTTVPGDIVKSIPDAGFSGYDKIRDIVADIASGLTSPLNAGLAISTGGTSLAARAGARGAASGLNAITKLLSAPVAAEGAIDTFSPDSSLGERGLGILETIGGIAGLKSKVPYRPEMPIEKAKEVLAPKKPKLKLNENGTFTNTETGELLDKKGKPVVNDLPLGQDFIPISETVPAPVPVTPSFKGSKRNSKLGQEVPPDIMLEVQATIPDAMPDEVVKHLGYVTDKKNTSKLTEAINFSRALKTSIDLSAPLRQGLPLALRGEFYDSLLPMIKSLGSENAFRLSQDEIASRALFRPTLTNTGGKVGKSFAEESGLFLSDLTDISRREEAIASTWAEKVPGVRASNRAYTTFLNRLRADTFENLVNSTQATNNPSLAKNLASYINNATGRGSLGQLESIAPVLNAALFSPRFISSRLQMFRPDKFISAPPVIKKEILKSLITTVGSGIALGEIARVGGSKVSNDPTSSDFRKIRIGDKVRIDPFAGYQQYTVAVSRVIEAAHKHYVQEKKLNPFEKPDAIAQRFLRSKASPVVSTAWDTITGTDYLGNRVNLPGELNDLFTPMFIETAIELFNEDPELLPWAVPAGLGMGVNVGGPKK